MQSRSRSLALNDAVGTDCDSIVALVNHVLFSYLFVVNHDIFELTMIVKTKFPWEGGFG